MEDYFKLWCLFNSMYDLSSIYLLDEMLIDPYIIILVLMRLVLRLLTPAFVSIFNVVILGVCETCLIFFNNPF